MTIHQRILRAKEERYLLRSRIARSGHSSLSLSLNVPGFPKRTDALTPFFQQVLAQLKRHLTAHRVFIDQAAAIHQPDDAGDFFIVPILPQSPPISRVKEICERFEQLHPVGRLIDVDITDLRLNPVSSGKAKPCFICQDKPAIVCMREGVHTRQQLRAVIFDRVGEYLNVERRERLCRDLSRCALRAVLYEVSLTPKAGTVDRFHPGSHRDMDFFTFMNSSAALSPRFIDMAKAGYDFDPSGSFPDALPIIRTIGLQMETDMFHETHGVNTHKGIIFLLGLSLFSAAFVIKRDSFFSLAPFIAVIKAITRGITANELTNTAAQKAPEQLTHGEVTCGRYGIAMGAGVRHEVENGLPTVVNYGIPVLQRALAGNAKLIREPDIKEPLTEVLLSIMSVNNDTNILFRGGPQQLERVKELAGETLRFTDPQEREQKHRQLMDYCLAENISPGGSADLLAVTMFIHFIRELQG